MPLHSEAQFHKEIPRLQVLLYNVGKCKKEQRRDFMPANLRGLNQMKHIFFINPAAGQGKDTEALRREILKECKERNIEPVIHRTESVGDAERTARRFAAEMSGITGEEARFYACGGDGTLNEVINGAAGYENIAVGAIPTGTGNDTIRNFHPSEKVFRSIGAQLDGQPVDIDLLRCRGVIGGEEVDRYCVNMINNGFDCNVVARTDVLKQRPFLAGSAAYMLAVFENFVLKKGITLTVVGDGETIIDGEVLFCAVCNGSYCGGGIYTAPQAVMSDGYLDLNIIHSHVTRRRFLKIFPDFSKGKHLERDDVDDLLTLKKCKTVELRPKGSNTFLTCIDGEVTETEGFSVELCPKALQFIVPKE